MPFPSDQVVKSEESQWFIVRSKSFVTGEKREMGKYFSFKMAWEICFFSIAIRVDDIGFAM